MSGTVVLSGPSGGAVDVGCEFDDRVSLGRQAAVSTTEIAYDLNSCKRVVEFGQVAEAPVGAPDTGAHDSDDSGG